MDNALLEKNRKFINGRVNKALFYNAFWTLSPVLAGCVLLIASSDYSSLIQFVDKGDLCLTSTAFFASSYYLFNENKDSDFVKLDSILSALCFPLIFIIAFLYAKTFQHSLDPTEPINLWFIRAVSFLFLFSSIFAFYRALKIESIKLIKPIDAKGEEKNEIRDIMDQLPDKE